jgi:hypothetical protein
MEEIQRYESEENEVNKYLTPGPQTQITSEIKEIVSKVDGTALEKTQKILDMGPSLVDYKEYNIKVFRKRTGSQIIQDKYITGCTDAALAFITLARASGIPTKYIETINKEWLESGGYPRRGHVYAQVYDDTEGKWVWVDPMGLEIVKPPGDRVIFKEGLDSWDIGIKNSSELKKVFLKFREEWLSQNTKE